MATENLPAPRQAADPGYLLQMGKLAVQGGLKQKVNEIQAAALIGFGMELGFQPFTALQCLDFIQGKATVNAAGMRALVAKELAELPKEWVEDEKGKMVAHCVIKRKGVGGEVHCSYSQATAEKAGTWGRGYWAANPEHMLQKTAFAFAARKAFGDLLMGVYIEGEMNGGEPMPVDTPAGVRDSRPLPKVIEASAGGKEGGIHIPAERQTGSHEPMSADAPISPATEAGLTDANLVKATEHLRGAALPPPPAAEPPPPEKAREKVEDEAHYREKVDRMAEDIANRTGEEKRAVIIKWSTFTDNNGRLWAGWDSVQSTRCKGKWLMATYRRLKDEWQRVIEGGGEEPTFGD